MKLYRFEVNSALSDILESRFVCANSILEATEKALKSIQFRKSDTTEISKVELFSGSLIGETDEVE